MKCFQCGHLIEQRALLVAMEQREHFATTRHADACDACALPIYQVIEAKANNSRYRYQSTNCWFCNDAHPIVRLRFDVAHHKSMHTPICEKCYMAMRTDLVPVAAEMCAFIEKEWQTPGVTHSQRMPWALGSVVHVHTCPAGGRWRGQFGIVQSARGLVQPWFGYEVRFADGSHHFFHERDLDYVAATLQELNNLTPVPPENTRKPEPTPPPPSPISVETAPVSIPFDEPPPLPEAAPGMADVPAVAMPEEFPLPDLSELPPLPNITPPPENR